MMKIRRCTGVSFIVWLFRACDMTCYVMRDIICDKIYHVACDLSFDMTWYEAFSACAVSCDIWPECRSFCSLS